MKSELLSADKCIKMYEESEAIPRGGMTIDRLRSNIESYGGFTRDQMEALIMQDIPYTAVLSAKT